MGTSFVPKGKKNTSENSEDYTEPQSVDCSLRKVAWVTVGLVVGSVVTFIVVNFPTKLL